MARQTNRSNISANCANISANRRILRIRQVCERTGLARSTIYAAISRGEFPQPVAILAGGRGVGWPSDAIDAFLERRLADTSTRQPTNYERALKAKAVAE
jgi:prophage regulatory protein